MGQETKPSYAFGPFRLDPVERLLLRDGEPVRLTLKAFDVLLHLVQNPGRLIQKGALMASVWPDVAVEENTLLQNISTLRKALGEDLNGNRYIETVPRLGYRFVARVKQEGGRSPGPSRTVLAAGAVLVLLAATAAYLGVSRARSVRSVAVLPFHTLGPPGEGDETLGMGMADALITRLSGLPGIVVLPASSTMKYRGPTYDALAAGRELGTDAVLDANIHKSGGRLRVTARLLRVRDRVSLWAESFDAQFTDVFSIEDSIASQVSRALALKLTPEARSRLAKRYTDNAEAYEFYLRGRVHLWDRNTSQGVDQAIQYFERALAKDPNYAMAWAGLADCYSFGLYMGSPRPLSEVIPKAKAAAKRALEIDEQLAEAHMTMAVVLFRYNWDWPAAEKEFRRALELDPNDALAHVQYAWLLVSMLRAEEALTHIARARELEPRAPFIQAVSGWILLRLRRTEEAIDQARRALDLDRSFALAQNLLAAAYRQKGMLDEALKEELKWRALRGMSPESLLQLREAYRASGLPGYWRKQLEFAERPHERAVLYARLGERDRAFEWLEEAYQERSPTMVRLGLDQDWDPLRSDRRFQDLLRRMGLRTDIPPSRVGNPLAADGGAGPRRARQ